MAFKPCAAPSPQRLPEMEHDRRVVRAFLRGQKLAVIATAHPLKPTPESALVAFAEDSEFNLYFQTRSDTRKAANLKTNPHVSFVIGLTLDPLITLQYEGVATELAAERELDACKQLFVRKESPTTEKYFNQAGVLFFKVRPTWIGYSDYSVLRPRVIELTRFGN